MSHKKFKLKVRPKISLTLSEIREMMIPKKLIFHDPDEDLKRKKKK